MKMNKKGMGAGLITFLVIIAVIIIIIVILSVVQVPYTISQSYQDKEPSVEHYTESVPYNDQQCNNIQMIYKITWVGNGQTQTCLQQQCASYNQVCTEKNFWGNCVSYTPQCATYSCVKYNNHCVINIENKESQGLNLKLQVQKYDRDTKSGTDVSGFTTDYYVAALDNTQVAWDFTSGSTENMGCIYHTLNSPTKNVCTPITSYRDEDRTRTIYTDVTKYRDVTQYCSAFSKLLGRCN